VGGRYHPAPAKWLLNPYVGGDIVGSVGTKGNTDERGTCDDIPFTTKGYYSYPKIGIKPLMGCDFYILPRVAIQMEYGNVAGFGSKSHITTEYLGQTYQRRGNLNRWHLTFGVKIIPGHYHHRSLFKRS
jgi:hypothetical protein